jgi:solute carrier family 66 (lysosomal lysine-arginine transporter), member 1
MASFLLTFLTNTIASPTEPALTTKEGLSGALGSISLACWIFLLLPQLIENYRNGSADAISLAFIFVWFIGDICNLAGALWAGLVPTVIAIAVYFCIADGVLIGQCLYYRIKNKRKQGEDVLRVDSIVEAVTENEPLLGRRRTESVTIPGSASRRRSSAASRRRSSISREDPLAKILEESDGSGAPLWVKNIFSILGIIAVGSVGWAIAYGSGVWKPSSEKHAADSESVATGAQILGYLSAVAYLGARIPQIIKNYQERSCEGMLPRFFFKE